MKTFDEIFIDCTKYGVKIKASEYCEQGKNIIVDQGQAKIAGYTDNSEGLFTDVPVIIFGDHTRTIKYIDTPFFLGADGTKVLKSKLEDANYKYLYYALKNTKIPNTGYSRHFKWLKNAKIRYPNIQKQEEIVLILDKIQKIIEYNQTQLARLDELIKARFVEMFGGIHDSKLYPYATIESFTSVMSGGTPDRGTAEYWQGGNIRWVKTTELQNCVITDTEEKITQLGKDNSSAKLIPPNSILIAMYGQGKTRGMTGYLAVECTTNQACACILPSKTINQKYLWQYMILSYDKLRDMAKGGNQPNLNAGIIKKFSVLMPPLEQQEQFAAFVEQVNKSKV
ncbi:restriction endonuclease subunit S, partial [Anaerotruncus sp. 80]